MKKIIKTKHAPAAIGPYSQAIDTGDFVFVAGQIPLNPATGKIEVDDVAGQTRQALENVKAILAAADLEMGHVVKTTVLLQTMDHFKIVNEVYATYFAGEPPARATYAAAGLPLGALIEIEVIAKR